MADRKRIALLLAQADEYYQAQFVEGFIGKAFEHDADVLVFGHTHEPLIRTILPDAPEAVALGLSKPLLLLNPGSAGSRTSPTFGTLTLRGGIPLAGHGTL